jgi:WD40 repeat protein
MDDRPAVSRFLDIPGDTIINCVVPGPGDILAVGHTGGLLLLDAKGKKIRLKALEDDRGSVTSVAFGPGDKVAVAHEFGGVMVLDTKGKQFQPKLDELKTRQVTSVAFGPRGMLAVGYMELNGSGRVLLLDAEGKHLNAELVEVYRSFVTSVAFSSKGILAVGYYCDYVNGGGRGGGVVLLDINEEGHRDQLRVRPEWLPGDRGLSGSKGERHRAIPINSNGVTSLAFGSDHKLAVGCENGGVVLLNAKGRQIRPEPIKVKTGHVTSVAFGLRGKIAVGYCDRPYLGRGSLDVRDGPGGVALFDADGNPLQAEPFVVKEGDVRSLAFGPTDTVTVGYSRGVVQFDVKEDRLKSNEFGIGSASNVAFGREGAIAAGDRNRGGGVRLFNAKGEFLLYAPTGLEGMAVESVAFGPRGTVAAGCGSGPADHLTGGLVLFDAKDKRLWAKSFEVGGNGVTSVAVDCEDTVAAGYDRHVSLFDAKGKGLWADPIEVENDVTSLARGPGGTVLVGESYGVVLLDAKGKRLWADSIKDGGVTSVAFGPGGRMAVGYNHDQCRGGGIVLFDAKGKLLRSDAIEVEAGYVTSVAFSPEGAIAAGFSRCGVPGSRVGGGGGVMLFDAKGDWLRPKPIEVVKKGDVLSVAFAPGGTIAAGYCGDDENIGVVLLDGDPASRAASRGLGGFAGSGPVNGFRRLRGVVCGEFILHRRSLGRTRVSRQPCRPISLAASESVPGLSSARTNGSLMLRSHRESTVPHFTTLMFPGQKRAGAEVEEPGECEHFSAKRPTVVQQSRNRSSGTSRTL